MDFRFTPEQEAWRRSVRTFLEEHVTPELRARCAEDHSEWDAELYQKFADAGFMGVSIDAAYGGQGRGYADIAILQEEMSRARVPHGVSTLHSQAAHWVGNAIERLGTEEQKRTYLPRIVSGEHRWALGLTEPGCGSDLAAVETRAVEDGDDFILTGTKIFNTAHLATHLFVVARSNPDVPKHEGIALFLLDLSLPGISLTAMETMRKWRRNIVYLDQVRVPKIALLGPKDGGWVKLLSVMDLERSGLSMPADMDTTLWEVLDYALEHERDGVKLSDRPEVRTALAESYLDVTIGRLLSYQVIWAQETGRDPYALASIQKLFNSEMIERVTERSMEILGPRSVIEYVDAGPAGREFSPLEGIGALLYKDARIMQIAGGTSEVQRNIIARSLGLPRS